MRKNFPTILKISVTILGLYLAIRQVDLNEIWQALVQAHLSWLLVSFFLMCASLVVRAYRWRLLLGGLEITVKFSRLVELYFVGNFFNAFLPSGFGGDIVRALEIARNVPPSTAAGTVILDRLAGLVMLFVMAMVFIPWRPSNFPPSLMGIIIFGSLAGVIGVFVLLEGSLFTRTGKWLPDKLSPTGSGPIARLFEAVQQCGRQAIWKAFSVSIVFNLILTGWWLVSGLALGQNISFSYYILIMPILSVPLLIPSISGLGPRELLAPTLFKVVGLTPELSISLSLLVFIINRLTSLLGGLIYIYITIRDNRLNAEKEY